MDDNWGNILYLILMALFVIVGALKKKKKPVENFEGAAERAEDEMPASIESLFDSLLGANTFAPESEHPYHVVQDEFVDEEDDQLPSSEMKVESKSFNSSKEVVVEKFVEDEEDIEENEEFDWRQAIIYKEILDRKYI
ncbi:hypothetical protein DWB61_02190 [Ancylomarina euxinus]|uniref:Uncharacterized protein n=1 Tax=Ancylomarina euxinus TaxID=2283627 RepID=A0A425Y8G1_9BACT|nr:hypothetical protein [Ancylomarina euxinus]MCZ4693282.1 hypothetical protein [Ancylomarina euxinus]MUP13509.1 hypothetical protein [Ancylomarina euxinus]RRG24839.1 hypothetical protein DWB61_02190 [Ancylomarina euxinus]